MKILKKWKNFFFFFLCSQVELKEMSFQLLKTLHPNQENAYFDVIVLESPWKRKKILSNRFANLHRAATQKKERYLCKLNKVIKTLSEAQENYC